MSAELPRPGVEVIQVFRSVSPTVITPTLPPCCVGLCRQIVDVLTPTSSGGSTLNNEALVPLHAGFLAKAGVGSPAVYAGLDGLAFVLSINNAPDLTIELVGTPLSPKQIVAQVLAAFGGAGVTVATAEVVGTTRWRLRSVAADEFQSIRVVGGVGGSAPAVLAAFGVGPDKTYVGASSYRQSSVVVNQSAFPDPRHNLGQLAIDPASIRAFLYMGGMNGTLTEVRRDRAFLSNGHGASAVLTGTAVLSSLTYGGSATVDGKTLIVTIDEGLPLTVTFVTPADLPALLVQINAVIGVVATATEDASHHLVIATKSKGSVARVEVGSGTANTDFGVAPPGTAVGVAAIRAIDSGTGATVTPLVQVPSGDFTQAASPAVVAGLASLVGGVADGLTLTIDDGSGPQTLTFVGASDETTTIDQIAQLFGSGSGGQLMVAADGSHQLLLVHSLLGLESSIRIVGGTALTALGLLVGTTRGATAYPPRAGDELYVNGMLLGIITQVAPGGVANTLKLDKQIPINPDLGTSYYIIARSLPGAGRPAPNVSLDPAGNVTIKSDLIRDTDGTPLPGANAQIYIAYHAIRQDVSVLAKSPALLRFNDTIALTNQLAPVNANNPLALALYFALLNAQGVQVTGLGVDAASAASPFGTVEAYARAATFLEGFEVYAIAPLTHDVGVGQLFDAHVTAMSSPEQKGERIVLFNPAAPLTKLDTLIASGLDGNSTTTSNQFDTGVANLGALLLAKGVSAVGALAVTEGVYLDVGNGSKYAITNITGPIVTVKTASFLPGENDVGYYAVTPLSGGLIAQPFAVRIRGAELVLTDGTVDLDGIASTYQAMAQSYQNRRVWHVIPDKCAATIEGVEQILEGFYLNAAIAGMIGKLPPQQSFTNYPMVGFTRVVGSSGFLSEKQLNIAAAGGNYIVAQDTEGTPLFSRMALTTDMTSIETRTDSITKNIDFTAKFLRRGLRNFIGRFNITQGFLDSLGHVIQGLGGFLVESGMLIGFNLNNIIQDESAPDTVLVDVTLDVPFPCNYIRLTLVI